MRDVSRKLRQFNSALVSLKCIVVFSVDTVLIFQFSVAFGTAAAVPAVPWY